MMKLSFIIIGCIIVSVLLESIIYYFATDENEDETSLQSLYNTLLIMTITSTIPFVLGCAVGLYAI